jgi:branched-chain amino acid transport system substrate-binding protein
MCCKKTPPCKKRIWGLSNRRSRFGLLAFSLALLWLAMACRTDPISCDDPLGCVVVRPGNPVQLVSLLPMSGETAVWGQELARGINLALSNRGGELLNHDLELIPLDSGCDPATGLAAIQNLDEATPWLGFIGPACSNVAEAVLPTIRRNDWLIISPGSTAPSLTKNASDQAFFRTVPNHLHQATVAAHFAFEQLGVRETAVFEDGSTFNSLLAQQFSDTFTQLGGSVIFQGSLTPGQTEVTAVLAEAAISAPELIYLALFEPEGNLIINRLAETSQLNQAIVLGADSLGTVQFASQIGETPAAIYVTGPTLAGAAYDSFQAAWVNRYETLPTNPAPAYAYDAAQLLLDAIEAVALVGQNGALVIGRGALRQQVAAIEITGVTGSLRCTPNGDCAAKTYGVYELDTAVRNSAFWPPPLVWQFE